MKQRIFADGMESVSLTEGMIRMELYNVPATARGTENGHDIFGEMIMTPQGFIRAFSAMENLVNQLVDAGIVKRNPTPEGQNSANSASVSPNFN